MTNPIEILLGARRRIAHVTILRILLYAALPLCATLSMAAGFNLLNALAFDHFGYRMEATPARLFQAGLLGLVLGELIAVAFMASRAWWHASDFIAVAEQVDRRVGGRQEIVTLAGLSDPARPETAGMRSPLFPILRARVMSLLETFDPRLGFAFEIRGPLVRSLILAAVAIIILGASAIALMRQPTEEQAASHRLELVAKAITASAPGPAQQQLASAAGDVAKDLANPKLPPQEKIAELRALEQEVKKFESQHQTAQQGRGNSSGSGSSSGNGNGGTDGQGGGRGSGAANGSGDSQNGSGAGHGSKAKQEEMVELHNEIAKARMKLEQQLNSGTTATAHNDSTHGSGAAPKPGSNPNQPGGQNSARPSGHVPQPQALANAKTPSGQSRGGQQNERGPMGDTHLGEFPKAGNYQRFYKLGEHGTAINVRDARYVSFQLPTEIESAGVGAVVPDNGRPRATTPYTNAPLKQQRLPVSADEQQLVPPRYRELIR